MMRKKTKPQPIPLPIEGVKIGEVKHTDHIERRKLHRENSLLPELSRHYYQDGYSGLLDDIEITTKIHERQRSYQIDNEYDALKP